MQNATAAANSLPRQMAAQARLGYAGSARLGDRAGAEASIDPAPARAAGDKPALADARGAPATTLDASAAPQPSSSPTLPAASAARAAPVETESGDGPKPDTAPPTRTPAPAAALPAAGPLPGLPPSAPDEAGRGPSFAAEASAEVGGVDSGRTAGTTGDRPTAANPMPPARMVLPQLVEAIRGGGAGELEVLLHPEELGRVRISLLPGDGTMQVSVQADRPETADLLRRNADLLREDLKSLGYGGVDISFAGSGGGGPAAGRADGDPATPGAATAEGTPVAGDSGRPAPPERLANGRLDLRL